MTRLAADARGVAKGAGSLNWLVLRRRAPCD